MTDQPKLTRLEIIYKMSNGEEHRISFYGPDISVNLTKDVRRKGDVPIFTGWIKAEIVGRSQEAPDEVLKAIESEFGPPRFEAGAQKL